MITEDMKNIFFNEFIAHPKWYLRENYEFESMDYYHKYFEKIHYIFGQMKGRMVMAEGILNYDRMGETVRGKVITIIELTDNVLNIAEDALNEDNKVFISTYYKHVQDIQIEMSKYREVIDDVMIPREKLYIGNTMIG